MLTYLSQRVPPSSYCLPVLDSSLHLKGPQGIIHLYPLWINCSPQSYKPSTGSWPLRTQNHSLSASPAVATLFTAVRARISSWVNYTHAYLAHGPETLHQQHLFSPWWVFLLDHGICAGHHVARQRHLLTSGFLLLWSHLHPHGSPSLMAASSPNYCQRRHLQKPLACDFGDSVWAWVLEWMNTWMKTIASQTPILHLPTLFLLPDHSLHLP